MSTINDFIKELQRMSPDKRELPLRVICPNGELAPPRIKMMWNDPLEWLEKVPDKMIITWE